MAVFHLNERVEYIGLGNHAGTIVAILPGIAPHEVQWDDPKMRNTRHTQYQITRSPTKAAHAEPHAQQGQQGPQ